MTNTENPTSAAVVGEYATLCILSDRYIVVIEKVTPKTVTVRHTYVNKDGVREPIDTSDARTFRWNEKRGMFVWSRYYTLALGIAQDYRDPSV